MKPNALVRFRKSLMPQLYVTDKVINESIFRVQVAISSTEESNEFINTFAHIFSTSLRNGERASLLYYSRPTSDKFRYAVTL